MPGSTRVYFRPLGIDLAPPPENWLPPKNLDLAVDICPPPSSKINPESVQCHVYSSTFQNSSGLSWFCSGTSEINRFVPFETGQHRNEHVQVDIHIIINMTEPPVTDVRTNIFESCLTLVLLTRTVCFQAET